MSTMSMLVNFTNATGKCPGREHFSRASRYPYYGPFTSKTELRKVKTRKDVKTWSNSTVEGSTVYRFNRTQAVSDSVTYCTCTTVQYVGEFDWSEKRSNYCSARAYGYVPLSPTVDRAMSVTQVQEKAQCETRGIEQGHRGKLNLGRRVRVTLCILS